MPLIEELPVTTTHHRATHGWTYIPDTGSSLPAPPLPSNLQGDPTSITTSAPLKSRKRGRDGANQNAYSTFSAANSGVGGPNGFHKLSAKQEKAIQQRLNDLNKENHREIHIAIPKRDRNIGGGVGGSAKTKDRKPTQNVRRILAYSRTFQHYLADEEAGVNVYGSAGIVAAAAASASAAAAVAGGAGSRKGDIRKKPGPKGGQKKESPKKSGPAKSVKVPSTPIKKETGKDMAQQIPDATGDVEMTDVPTHPPASAQDAVQTSTSSPPVTDGTKPSPGKSQPQTRTDPVPPPIQETPLPPSPPSPSLDQNPLLKTLHLPHPASTRLMSLLLSEPPLSYNAARAKPLECAPSTIQPTGNNTLTAKPPRYFCAICGYWGKVRCAKGCGERVCGLLECWRGHEGVCALAGY